MSSNTRFQDFDTLSLFWIWCLLYVCVIFVFCLGWGIPTQDDVCVPPWHLYPVDGRLSSRGPALCHSNAQTNQINADSTVSLSWIGLQTTSQISPKWTTIRLLSGITYHILSLPQWLAEVNGSTRRWGAVPATVEVLQGMEQVMFVEGSWETSGLQKGKGKIRKVT